MPITINGKRTPMFFEYDHQVFVTDVAHAHTAHLASGSLVGVEARP